MIGIGQVSTEASWQAATRRAEWECHTLANDLNVDVCVIGGGIAGLTVAFELGRRGQSVAVIEAQNIGDDGLERGVGLVAPGYSASPERLLERAGADGARALWALSREGVSYVRSAAQDLNAESEPTQGCLGVALRDAARPAQYRLETLHALGETDAEFWSTEQVRDVLRSGVHHQALYVPSAIHINPLEYSFGLARKARSVGARIYEGTKALEVDPEGVRKRVRTEAGRVRAREIVFAGSRAAALVHPAVAAATLTLSSGMSVSRPLGDRLRGSLRFAGTVLYPSAPGRSHRVIDGDRLLWTGPPTSHLSLHRRHERQTWRDIARTYPQLGEVAVERSWTVTADYAAHQMPQIGALAPGLWTAAAFGMHGIATATMAGCLIARAIDAGDDSWRRFQSYGLVWTGGRLGRALASVVLYAKQMRARWDSAFAPSLPALAALIQIPAGQGAPAIGPDAASTAVTSPTAPPRKGRRQARKPKPQQSSDRLLIASKRTTASPPKPADILKSKPRRKPPPSTDQPAATRAVRKNAKPKAARQPETSGSNVSEAARPSEGT